MNQVKNNYFLKARLALAFLVMSFFLSACPLTEPDGVVSATTHSAYVTKVKDGDSVILRINKKEVEARLFGIDAPELNQPYGKEAKNALSKLALKKTLSVTLIETDKYDRAVVILKNKNSNINQNMLENGHAWVYRQYQSDKTWIRLEQQAKKNKQGLWRFPRPLPPWEWRRKR